MNACRGSMNLDGNTLKKEIRLTTAAEGARGPLKRKRPFARVVGHPYDRCLRVRRVEGFLGRGMSPESPERPYLICCVCC